MQRDDRLEDLVLEDSLIINEAVVCIHVFSWHKHGSELDGLGDSEVG